MQLSAPLKVILAVFGTACTTAGALAVERFQNKETREAVEKMQRAAPDERAWHQKTDDDIGYLKEDAKHKDRQLDRIEGLLLRSHR